MSKHLRWVAVIGILFVWSSPRAVVGQVFRERADVASLGLRIPLFAGARAEVLPMPEVRVTVKDRKDVYNFRDLWYRTQWVAEWSAGGGARLRLARPTWLAPAELLEQYILAEKFNEVKATAAPPASSEEMVEWLGNFTKGTAKGPQPITQRFLQVAEAVRYDLDLDGPAAVAYAFRMKPNPHGVPTNEWYVVVVESKSADTRRLSMAMEQEWLRTVVAVAPPRASGDAVPGPMGENQAQMGSGQDSSREASRLAALRSIEGQKGWWALSGSNYVIVTSIKPTQRRFVEGVLQQLETLRALWQTMAPPERPIEVVSVVRLFGHRDEYEQYAGEKGKNTGGLWDPAKRELCISPMEHLVGSEQRQWLAEVLYHEGLHQYFFYAYPKGETPVWYNEGHATLMEEVEFGKTGVEIGEVDRYVQIVDRQVRNGNRLRFAQLIRMSYPEFYAPQPERRSQNYARAWALIYYLRKGAPVAGEMDDAAILQRFHQAMLESGKGKEATEMAFDGVDLEQLEDRFLKFWNSTRLRSQARKLALGASDTLQKSSTRTPLAPPTK